ncbi:flagellar assembly protein FliX [Breoghania sp. L-A4]|uniref:flagellar assembly protein FliX n=1 Tax=Breoghania sp. L-A4 TaxID=2304600 RepID=UPI001966CF6B|nr:flagellar assembly protein FliX [Breoghania sp. L-A4]
MQSRPAAKRNKKSGATFSTEEPTESARSGTVAGSGAVHGVDALLSLQEIDDPLVGRKRAVKRGHDMLDALEAMHAALLAGNVPGERLERITQLISMRAPSGDPSLEAMIDDIELRARVELAKLGRFPA